MLRPPRLAGAACHGAVQSGRSGWRWSGARPLSRPAPSPRAASTSSGGPTGVLLNQQSPRPWVPGSTSVTSEILVSAPAVEPRAILFPVLIARARTWEIGVNSVGNGCADAPGRRGRR